MPWINAAHKLVIKVSYQASPNLNDPAMESSKTLKLFFTLTTLTTLTANSQTQPNPTDSFLLSCGANTHDKTTDANNRKWTSDTRFIVPSKNISSVSATAQSQDPSLPSTVPYMSARIFLSETTYRFPVSTENPHWIRLHFYPSPYRENNSTTIYNPQTSFFSVTANNFTLLANFSSSITSEALNKAYIIREFSVFRSPSGVVDFTFTPSPNSFAFVNGIEVISMPAILLSSDFLTMQTMFRLNVGGQYIEQTDGRIWFDDSPYIYGAGFGVTTKAGKDVKIAYPLEELRDVAPMDVYSTARSMGPNATINANYNLTWVFEVDVDFSYLVRLHFCDYRFDKMNQMVFEVFLNNRTVTDEADVIRWSGGKGVPVYKDYTIRVENGDGLLWIALHPNVDNKPEYYDSILNGVEVFKVNDTHGSLAGPNPKPLKRDSGRKTAHHSKPNKGGMVAGAVLGTLTGFGLIVCLVIWLLKRKTRIENYWLPILGSSSSSSRISNLLCRRFMLSEIRQGTDGFSESRVVGVGGFGKVYKGFIFIDGKLKIVAVKRANPSSNQGVHEFLNEIDLLSKLRHRHLVSLIGACEENNEMILVYDYMENGTLRENIYETKNRNLIALSWIQRLTICIGAAKGIHYLHTGAKSMIIHRDVKSTNILLDGKWVAKVSDFGLSKIGHQGDISTVVKGSFGYLDPEYLKGQKLTDKSDVYSFGVVLFEVLCGRLALDSSLPKEEVSLADWVILNKRKNRLEEIIDTSVKDEIGVECLKKFVETGVKCLSEKGVDRPSMGELLWNLEYCLQLQKSHDGAKGDISHSKA